MKTYTQAFQTTETPQSEPIPGTTQVPNSAGGFAWGLDDWGRLQRFLILGTEGGSYYVGERELTKDNANVVLRCLKVDPARTIQTIVDVSTAGRAPKNDPAVFALAMAAGMGDPATRRFALDMLPRVCRIGTHVFHFAQAVQGFRGWGRGLRGGIAKWYEQMPPDKLAYQVVKYHQRDGWSHSDLLRLSHPTAPTAEHKVIYDWVTPGGGLDGRSLDDVDRMPIRLLAGMEYLKEAATANEVASLIREYRLPREAVENASTEWLKSVEVWDALLEDMPLEAMVRNLGAMTARGVLRPLSNKTGNVADKLGNQERILKSRLHPLKILAALVTYQGGKSRGGVEWTPVQSIVDALDRAFYLAFGNVQATGKRIMLALDVSGSMSMGQVAGVGGLTPRAGAAAMALVTAATEPNHVIVSFQSKNSSGVYRRGDDGIIPLDISPRERLDDVIRKTDNLPFGGTDCALPMIYAWEEKLAVDAFVIITDSETWAGEIHPAQALRRYRAISGINSKLVVVGMVSNGFTIADPNDLGMLDIVGFDTATPQLISDFIAA